MNLPFCRLAQPRARARLRYVGCLAAIVVALWAAPTGACAEASPAASDYRVFFDEFFQQAMTQHQIPGIAAAMVQGDRIVYQAGYGVADRTTHEPVDPERTRFPLGSISKLFTTVAVLQLVEQHRLDLDADINRYIAPNDTDDRFATPVTLRHLLTHTDGFDVRWLVGGAARSAEEVRPLQSFLTDLPPRVVPPGQLYLYSDVGMTIAGCLVERAASMPFADYMDQRLFGPLQMRRTTFRPIDEHSSRAEFATGYDYGRAGVLRPVPTIYPHAVPACGATGPVGDLAILTAALLNGGSDRHARVLSPASVREMELQQFTQAAGVPGTAFGFYEYWHNGRRCLLHGGLIPGFTTLLMLMPEEHIGLCIAANRFDLTELFEREILQRFFDRFFPAPVGQITAKAIAHHGDPAVARALAGRYRTDQYSRYSVDKVMVLAGYADEILVQARPDGSLRFLPDGSEWQPIAPYLFENEMTGERVAFRTDEHGDGVRIVGSAQFMSYRRLAFFERLPMQATLVGLLAAIACGGAVLAIFATWRHRPLPGWRAAVLLRWQRRIAVALALGTVGMIAFLANTVARLNFTAIAFGEPEALSVLRLFALLLGGIALAQLALAAATTWKNRARGESLAYAFASAAAVALLPFLVAWNVIALPEFF